MTIPLTTEIRYPIFLEDRHHHPNGGQRYLPLDDRTGARILAPLDEGETDIPYFLHLARLAYARELHNGLSDALDDANVGDEHVSLLLTRGEYDQMVDLLQSVRDLAGLIEAKFV